MKSYPLRSDRVSLAVTETGGHLSDVEFCLADGRRIIPMHVAPWAGETLPDDDIPPILKVLRGDFFCAPFGASDLLPEAPAVHGLPAGGRWRLSGSADNEIVAALDGDVMGATIVKRVMVRAGESVIYQRHLLTGGSGRIPIGHHAMLRADGPLALGFGPWTTAVTPPDPVEEPPHGRPLLAHAQIIADLHKAPRAGGGTVDLKVFPSPDGFEALWMLVADQAPPFGWTTATAVDSGWLWFGLKDQRVLPETLFWFSNGGRDYPPWNGRHRRVVGLEEICGYFHLGHKASIADNPVAANGTPTAVELRPDAPLTVSYVFGVADAPAGFGAVTTAVAAPGGVTFADAGGREVFAACDLSFLTGK